MAIVERKLQGIPANRLGFEDLDPLPGELRSGEEAGRQALGHFLANGAGTTAAQVFRRVDAEMAVLPFDLDAAVDALNRLRLHEISLSRHTHLVKGLGRWRRSVINGLLGFRGGRYRTQDGQEILA